MRKFKLKQWYPTLPEDWEVGMILNEGNEPKGTEIFDDYYFISDGKYTNKAVTRKIIENNPDFWEEVK